MADPERAEESVTSLSLVTSDVATLWISMDQYL